jgi:hypothetical protein
VGLGSLQRGAPCIEPLRHESVQRESYETDGSDRAHGDGDGWCGSDSAWFTYGISKELTRISRMKTVEAEAPRQGRWRRWLAELKRGVKIMLVQASK